MTEPSSVGSQSMDPPSEVRTLGKLAWYIDWSEVSILDPENAKTIVTAHKSQDFSAVLCMMVKKCKLSTVK